MNNKQLARKLVEGLERYFVVIRATNDGDTFEPEIVVGGHDVTISNVRDVWTVRGKKSDGPEFVDPSELLKFKYASFNITDGGFEPITMDEPSYGLIGEVSTSEDKFKVTIDMSEDVIS